VQQKTGSRSAQAVRGTTRIAQAATRAAAERDTTVNRKLAARIALIAGLLIIALAGGTIGFIVIEGYPWQDAFYMTLITITTVGYAEVHPLSPAGRLFNSVLILYGVSAMFFSVGAITQTVIELQLHNRLGERRRKRAIMRLRDHYIVCGYGRVGRNAALELQRAGVPFVVIDNSDDRVEHAMHSGMLAVVADAMSDETLREAGIAHARGFIAALSSDAENVFAVLSARSMNPAMTIVTRASEEDAEAKLRRAGANIVFSPYAMAGHRLAQALVRPLVAELLNFAPQGLIMEQLEVSAASSLSGRSLRDLLPDGDRRALVLALRNAAGEMVFNPPPSSLIAAGDFLIVMGERPELQRLEGLLTRHGA
jgi:voltage-gated potassium channel